MEVSIDNAEIKFSEHLKQSGNQRIFFSGKFGTGKSYFLRKYFENKEDSYNLFWLSPVNYVVGANQDIFEWIKIDITKQLIENELLSKQRDEFSDNLILQTYLYQKNSTLFSRLMLSIADIIGKKKTGISILDSFRKEIDEYYKFKKTVEKEAESDESKILSYLEQSFQSSGSIYEDDLTTQIIRVSIELLKHNSKKETVLIIDDIDRLDPEHIFRILNILSAHNDHFDTNKFGFQKVILVCDLDNIKNLYEHRYGRNVDFDGYIEKFYTYEPFRFSIKYSVANYCKSDFLVDNIDEACRNALAYSLSIFCSLGLLNIRNIKKITSDNLLEGIVVNNKVYVFDGIVGSGYSNRFIESSEVTVGYKKMDFIKCIFLLCQAFGGIDKLKAALKVVDSKTNYLVDKSVLVDIESSLIVLSTLSKNVSNITNAFCMLRDRSAYGPPKMDYPQTVFMGNEYVFLLKWDTTKMYSNGDYFEDVKIHKIGNSSPLKINSFFQEIDGIIDFVVNQNMFFNTQYQNHWLK